MSYRRILSGVVIIGALVGSALFFRNASATNYQVISLSATPASQSQVNIYCSGAPNSYVYMYRDGSYWGYGLCNGATWYDTGRTCNTSYTYTATDAYDSRYYSNPAVGTTDQCTPGVPTIGTNTPASQLAFTTTWSRNAPLTESGFEVNSSLTPFPANTAAGATSYTENWAVSCNTTGNNSVRSFITTNGRTYYSGMSAASNNATTDACTPAAPTMTSAATVNQSQVIVYFTDNSTNETGFYIMTSGGSQMGSSGAIGGTGSPTAGYATGLSCNVSDYFYADAYVNTNGRTYRGSSAWSNYVATDQCTPGAATIGTATAVNQTSATVTWTRGSPYTETAFNIWDQTPTFRGSAGAGATSGNATGLTCNTSYQFRVVPYVTGVSGATYTPGQTGQTNSITTGPCTPTAPSGLSATAASQTQANLSWADNSNNESGFGIQRCTGASCSNFADVLTPAANAVSISDTGLSCGTTYQYRMYAYVNGTGGPYYSGYSNTASVTTNSCDTTPPSVSFNPTSNSWSSATISVTPTASDASGVSYTRHCWVDVIDANNACDAGTTAASTFTNGTAVTYSSDTGSLGVRLCVRARDTVGNWSGGTCASPYYKDSVAPAFSSKTTYSGWYNANQTSTFTYTDALSGMGTVTGNTCTITEGSAQTCATTALSACDVAGNCNITNLTSNAANIDKTAPTFSSKTTFSGWYNAAQTSTFIYTDALSGIASGNNPTCSIGEGSAQTCTLSGKPNVIDVATNSLNPNGTVSNAANVDLTNPVPGTTWSPSSGPWHNTSTGTTFTLTGSTDTGGSGMAASSYPCTTGVNNGNTCTATVYDVAGNSAGSAASPPNRVDTTAPSCGTTWTPNPGPWHNTLTGTSFTLTGSTDTGGSGITASSYNCTTGPNNTNTCYATIGDNAGNTADCGPSPTNNVDQTNPSTGTLSANPSGWTNGSSASITGTVTDAGGSGVAGYYYKCTSGGSYVYAAGSSISFSCSTTGGQTAYVYGVDGATNTNSASPSSVSYYIDTTNPTASISGNSVNENSAMTLNSNGADTGGSNVASYAWYSGTLCSGSVLTGGTSATYSAGTQPEPYSTNYAVKVTDGAGNTVCATAAATWANVAPTASASVSPNPICNGSSTVWTASPSDPGGTTFSYQWYNDGSCSSLKSGATASTLTDTGTYPSTARSVVVKDAQNAAASCAPATVTVNSCVSAPSTLSPSTDLDPGRPRVTFSWSSNAVGYQIWRYALGASSSTRTLYADTANSSFTIQTLSCPAGYTFEFVAYNADVSVSGVDSSCSLWQIYNSKCSSASVANTKVEFCTRLFLNQ